LECAFKKPACQLLPSPVEEVKESNVTYKRSEVCKINVSDECKSIRARRRLDKVRKYLEKKRRRLTTKSHVYQPRKQVAEKRLRIKGRFVTKEQAFAILGVSQQELLSIENVQGLLSKLANDPIRLNTIFENGNVKG
jgi:hypothetical protein